ncbi:MAG: hypothetical protein RMY34_27520 [Aulosira sp. DedQUE10]|nr:hypothetical protein [Aulosira sp. DedQUE10]
MTDFENKDVEKRDIESEDVVKLNKNLNNELQEGLVGIVTQSDQEQDNIDVNFPLPGKNLHAQVSENDIDFLTRAKPQED